jgi:hypothetical protein
MPSGVGIKWRRFMIGILADNSVTVLTEEVTVFCCNILEELHDY